MKTHEPRQRPVAGSFGIPQEMQDAHKAFQDKKAATAAGAREEAMAGEDQEGDAEEPEHAEGEDAEKTDDPLLLKGKDPNRVTPRKALAELGIELTDKDFHSILYRGYMEKVVEVVPALGSVTAMMARIKTLTPDDYDLVDELVAEDLDTIKGTNLGFQTRRELWTISLSTIEINGREIAQIKRDKSSEPDLRALARERRKMLSQLSPAVINKLIKINSTVTWAIAAIVEDPKANF